MNEESVKFKFFVHKKNIYDGKYIVNKTRIKKQHPSSSALLSSQELYISNTVFGAEEREIFFC